MILCVECGTHKNITYMKPGEERCQECAKPIFEQMKRDREKIRKTDIELGLRTPKGRWKNTRQ